MPLTLILCYQQRVFTNFWMTMLHPDMLLLRTQTCYSLHISVHAHVILLIPICTSKHAVQSKTRIFQGSHAA